MLNKLLAFLRKVKFAAVFMVDSAFFCHRYIKFSRSLNVDNKEKLQGQLVATYHVLEKGLSFENRKNIFGESVARGLFDIICSWIECEYEANRQFYAACRVLKLYTDVVDTRSVQEIIRDDKFECVRLAAEASDQGGVKELSATELIAAGAGNFSQLSAARKSVRSFSKKPVPVAKIRRCVELAQNSPSVCNRQSFYASYFSDTQKIKDILSLQNGNRGFGDQATGLFVISVSMSSFSGVGERNQCFIDGGLFSMSLLYALTSEGIASCSLNWCQKQSASRKMRNATGLPETHEIIMLIAVGNYSDEFYVPFSTRQFLDETLWLHE